MIFTWVVGCFVVCGQYSGAFVWREETKINMMMTRRKIPQRGRTELYASHQDLTRRCALQGIVTCFFRTTSTAAFAQDIKRPSAPLENLLPATRVKVLIDQAASTAKAIEDGTTNNNNEAENIALLKHLLLEPQSFMTKEEARMSERYLEIDTLKDWNKARQKEAQIKFQIEQVDPLTRLNEGFEQWGERRQFQRLQRQQLALEKANAMRAAFNAYTNNLVFGDSYLLTASQTEKSRLIRTYDQLPDVTSVIRSDLDLRDLYRNQVLTKIDDAKAELQYQLKKESGLFDASELVSLLSDAQTCCDKWFEFVPEKDAKQALDKVLSNESL